MSFLFSEDWFVSLVVGGCVFVICYFWSDRVILFFQTKSLGTKQEVLMGLEKMLVEVDQKRIKLMLFMISYGLGVIVFLLLWPNIFVGLGFAALISLLGIMIPKVFIKNMWEKRSSRVVYQMVDGLTIMGNSIKAGQSITQAMERVVENIKGPFSQEMGLILNKIRLGMSTEVAISEFAERIARQDVQMLATAIIVLKETGGNLAETFTTIVSTIRDRQKVEKKIEALTAQGSMQALIITFVPFFLIGMFLVVEPDYIMPLFTRPLGWFLLLLMISLQTLGLVIMKKIVTIKV
ncbi:MAG: type II secretion system F family protein [Bdellovibrionales bacterium]|nr:type II secretion system F family protein [Bdellovibrionales bacterium]